ncbi:menaquinone-dependent protoporphyrinogen IX dehydrogenase [Psittacicella gerlachiana]|uniref:Protoporphyrinogen IX dehydrogenase [quinone] n=1 Tax=Psittacicella gerlachiana TaxID=2028574 RepID=A0A3A1YH04_9GAMM|nr:menaquinone-dependent protoporphyrinogen IX dehydrogenase [Psittacicella gerlachiana]RIY36736.1 hypothetical protein CKF59_02445 [Psittacicella gerlachiana]
MTKVLLLSGTREGHTAKINDFIAQKLQENQKIEILHLTLEQALQDNLDLSDFKAIVVGASIHYGHFPKALNHFVAKHLQELQTQPSYFFGVNLTARKAEKSSPQTNVYVRKFLKSTPWQPQQVAVFAGALNYAQLNFFDRNMIRFIMWLTKGDTDPKTNKVYTNWQAVTEFAQQISQSL